MGDYLRDKSVPFLTIKSDDLDLLNSDLSTIMKKDVYISYHFFSNY